MLSRVNILTFMVVTKKSVFDKLVVPTVFTALLCIIIQKALYGNYATANILRKQRKEVLNWDALLR